MRRFFRDSFWGRVVYHLSKHKYFYHKEEDPNYVVPEFYYKDMKATETSGFQRSNEAENELDKDNETLTLSDDGRIIVGWDGEDDPERPVNWPLWQKSIFILQICTLTTTVYMASAIYTPGVEIIMAELGISRVKATLPLTMFVIGYGLGPMVLSPMSENAIFGRTSIYIVTLFLFFILQIPISLVNDLAALSVLRFISGVFASPALATGGASMGDITNIPYMPVTIALWSISAVCGPSLGPFFGSILIVKRNWHWSFWLVCMTSGIAFLVLGFCLPETYEKTLLARKAKRLRSLTGNPGITSQGELENEGLTFRELAEETLWRPIEIIIFEPVVLLINLYIALVYSILYLWFEAFPIVFLEIYKFDLIPMGITFISVIVGVLLGAVVYITQIYRLFTLPYLRNEEIFPEVFIPPMIVGAISMPIGIFIFGWTASSSLHWIGPLIGSAVYSVGAFIIFQTGFNYLGASFPNYLASVFAGNDLFRSLIAGCFPLFGSALFKNLSTEKFPVAYGSTILGCISALMILIPILFYVNGPKLRARSKYAN